MTGLRLCGIHTRLVDPGFRLVSPSRCQKLSTPYIQTTRTIDQLSQTRTGGVVLYDGARQAKPEKPPLYLCVKRGLIGNTVSADKLYSGSSSHWYICGMR
jgi:hypothetical protein